MIRLACLFIVLPVAALTQDRFADIPHGNVRAGSGGAPVHFIQNGATSAAWQGANRKRVRLDDHLPTLILLARHGSHCDGYGAQACGSAVAVAGGSLAFVTAPEPIAAE